MAAKKSTKKKVSGPAAKKAKPAQSIHLEFTRKHLDAAEACIKKSGVAKITIKEVKVTKVPRTLSNGVLID
ncbi:MAG: hypothetical protein ACR2KX_13195 [Chitinophagaceae bacterium]